ETGLQPGRSSPAYQFNCVTRLPETMPNRAVETMPNKAVMPLRATVLWFDYSEISSFADWNDNPDLRSAPPKGGRSPCCLLGRVERLSRRSADYHDCLCSHRHGACRRSARTGPNVFRVSLSRLHGYRSSPPCDAVINAALAHSVRRGAGNNLESDAAGLLPSGQFRVRREGTPLGRGRLRQLH